MCSTRIEIELRFGYFKVIIMPELWLCGVVSLISERDFYFPTWVLIL